MGKDVCVPMHGSLGACWQGGLSRRMNPSVMERVAQLKQYLVDVRTEARKVVWPTRKDTVQTTLVVFGMVVAVSLFLWVVDALLALVVQLVIG
ncbi:MAG: preprotein translocase subunit SecE [Magnetococcus sp. YQC-3]